MTARQPIAARVPEEIASHLDEVAESPVTEFETRSDVVRSIVIKQFQES